MDPADDPVPRYTETPGADTKDKGEQQQQVDHQDDGPQQDEDEAFFTRVANAKSLPLPVLVPPPDVLSREQERADPEAADILYLTFDIVSKFFASIESGRDELIREFVSRGIVSPDVKNTVGETPLLAAVRLRSMPTIHLLLSLGAQVDEFGTSPIVARHALGRQLDSPKRTPLQLAAQTGYLAAVKVLMEEYGANDALMATDGQLALRLAAENKHREVVEYLPQQRGGAWLRWKATHKREMYLIKRALSRIRRVVLIIIWHVPKYFVYNLPKDVAQEVWRKRDKILPWIKRKAVEVPKKVAELGKRAVKRTIKEIKDLPKTMKRLGDFIVRTFKNIYKALVIVCKYIAHGAGKVGTAVWELIKSTVSLLHTAITSIITWFKTATLQDIRDGCIYVLRALFLALPIAAFDFIKNFGDMSYRVLKVVFGSLGKALWWVGSGLLFVVAYIPRKLWDCVEAIGRLLRRGGREVRVCFDPKSIG